MEHARQLHHAGRWEEAEQLYSKALCASPGETAGLHLSAVLHADTGRPDTATLFAGTIRALFAPSRLAFSFTSADITSR